MEKEKKKSKKLFSDAFPEVMGQKTRPKIHAEVHKILKQTDISVDHITYRRPLINEIPELLNLHKEWFPIEYTEQYFKDIIENKNGIFISIAAVVNIEDSEYIIGLILAECKPERQYNSQVPERYRRSSFFENNRYQYIYIMTFGVVDECRGLGMGSKLLDRLVTEVRKVNCNVLYLHVVDYNKTAIRFYERNEFQAVSTIRNYYRIQNDIYDTKVMIRFLQTDGYIKVFWKAIVAILLFIPFLIKSWLCRKKMN
jgi:ribosomal protein S18 acetylase RimI-like enzyme